jgi:hypothetical protein
MVAVWESGKVPSQPGIRVPVNAVNVHETVTTVLSPALPAAPRFVPTVEQSVWPAAVRNASTVAVTAAEELEGIIPSRAPSRAAFVTT